MFTKFIHWTGVWARDRVLAMAGLLREDQAPGLVVLLLAGLLIISLFLMWRLGLERIASIRWFCERVSQINGPEEFGAALTGIDRSVEEVSRKKAFHSVAHAWKEYRETLIPYDGGDGIFFRNSVRPSVFFNLEDLHYGPGLFKILPGLFVSVGLFLTFLGLVSALDSMGAQIQAAGGEVSSLAMTTLLKVASAKFIMSLTGLLCSIILTIFLRQQTEKVDQAINQWNRLLENKVTFISLEALGIEQLQAVREQKDHFKAIGMELVAELGRPLREELPQSISESIKTAMAVLVDRLGQKSTEGLGDMLKDLSGRISSDVGVALESSSQRLIEAAAGLDAIVVRMNQSSGSMGTAMEGAIERLGISIESLRATMAGGAKETVEAFSKGSDALLATMNATLAEIARNTGQGSLALREAAEVMSRSAESISNQLEQAAKQGALAAGGHIKGVSINVGGAIEGAGREILAAFQKASIEMGEVARKMTETSSDRLLRPLADLGVALKELVGSVGEASQHTKAASLGMRNGAEAASEAAGSLRGSAQILNSASNPIATSVQALLASTRAMETRAANISEANRVAVVSVAKAIQTAADALAGERDGVRGTLKLLESCLSQMRGQGDRLDEMDVKLGRAFEGYRNEVENALEGLEGHVRRIQEEYAPALSTLQTLVEQIEQFVPSSRRRS